MCWLGSQGGVKASCSVEPVQAEHTELHHRLLASTTAEHAALEEVERLRAAAERLQVLRTPLPEPDCSKSCPE